MEFHIDKNLRRRCSSKIIGATLGGKIALTLCSICTVLFFVSLVLMLSYTAEFLNSDHNEDLAIKSAYAALAFSAFLMAGPIGLIITYRQRNAGVAMRTRERLVLEGGWLRYSFRLSNDRDCYGLDDIAINLRECSLRRGASGECVFAGGVFRWHYENVLTDRPRSFDEMEPTPTFEIWPYWSPELYETLLAEQQRLAAS